MKFIHVESPKSTLVRPHRFFWHPKDHSCLRALQLASQGDRPSVEAGCRTETDKGHGRGSGPLHGAPEAGPLKTGRQLDQAVGLPAPPSSVICKIPTVGEPRGTGLTALSPPTQLSHPRTPAPG